MRMPQAMEACHGQVLGIAYPPPIAAEVVGRQHLTFDGAEHKPRLAALPQRKPKLDLLLPVGVQHGYGFRGQADVTTPAPRFWRLEKTYPREQSKGVQN